MSDQRNKTEEQALDALLIEALGRVEPPDLTAPILKRLASRGSRGEVAPIVAASALPKPVPKSPVRASLRGLDPRPDGSHCGVDSVARLVAWRSGSGQRSDHRCQRAKLSGFDRPGCRGTRSDPRAESRQDAGGAVTRRSVGDGFDQGDAQPRTPCERLERAFVGRSNPGARSGCPSSLIRNS